MSDFSNLRTITKNELIKKYKLTEKKYNNLRKRISERIKNAKKLYLWNDEEVPTVTQLLDYSLKRRRFDVQKYEVILATPSGSRISLKAKKEALRQYSGRKGGYNSGFGTFSEGIPQFIIMESNANNKLNNSISKMEKLDHFRINFNISTTADYYIKNNEYGKIIIKNLNLIIDEYNRLVDYTTQFTALPFYIIYVRKMMEQISFAEKYDAIAGSH